MIDVCVAWNVNVNVAPRAAISGIGRLHPDLPTMVSWFDDDCVVVAGTRNGFYTPHMGTQCVERHGRNWNSRVVVEVHHGFSRDDSGLRSNSGAKGDMKRRLWPEEGQTGLNTMSARDALTCALEWARSSRDRTSSAVSLRDACSTGRCTSRRSSRTSRGCERTRFGQDWRSVRSRPPSVSS